MHDKTMAINARNILLLTASAFCLSAAGSFLATGSTSSESLRDSNSKNTQTTQANQGLPGAPLKP